MSTNEPPNTPPSTRRREACVIVVDTGAAAATRACLDSLRTHTAGGVPVESVSASAAELNAAIARLAPADVAILLEPCRVSAGWLQRLAAAAHVDTNNASASALTRGRGDLSLSPQPRAEAPADGDDPLDELAAGVAERSLSLRPRISRAAGPCVYVRREALELVGGLDEDLGLADAVELDLSQRCLLAGMTHVAADDVVVEALAPAVVTESKPATTVGERYPYLGQTPLADSGVLGHALRSAAPPAERLVVTLDARALDGAVTGTQVHVLELILALARTEALALRLLVRAQRIDRPTRELLEGLPATELLAAETLAEGSSAERSLSAEALAAAPRTAVFHRPQQTFSPGDVQVALALGERFVLSQLDLIAYRNPGYFADADTWEDFRAASRHGLSAAERVLVFSEHTRAELLADALVEEQRIRVVPPGLDHRPAAEPRRPEALGGGGGTPGAAAAPLEPGFLLCLGTDFRHKNRVFALRLLSALREHHGWQGRLVLAGTHVATGSSAELERSYLREHPELSGALVELGPVGEPERAWLVANAGAVVYPSAYEGFGLVPFESALAGVPCLFAPYASLAEVAPEGAASIVPWDPVASAAAAYELLTDEHARARHVDTLAARARTFTWDAAAAAMVEIYREAALAPVRDSATLSRDLVRREARLSVQHEVEVHELVGEREHAKRMYDELNAEVGTGLALIGPNGALPDSVQRALLALAARPALSRPLFSVLSGVYELARAFSRPVRTLLRRSR